jgi:PAS domain S-box-containing protein
VSKSRNIVKIILGTAVIAVLVFLFVLIEYFESKNELLKSLNNEAVNLNNVMSLNFENNFITNAEIENQIVGKLKAIGELISHQKFPNEINKSSLTQILKNNQIDHISIINKNRLFLFNSDSLFSNLYISDNLYDELQPLVYGDFNWIDLGPNKGSVSNDENYLIAFANDKKTQIVFIGINQKKILDFRKRIGIGNQIKELSNNSDIKYIVLQDDDGIYTASENIKEISAIESDSFLVKARNSNEVMTRMIEINGSKVFEAVKSLKIDNQVVFLNRIGLSLENVMSIQQKSMRRVALIGIGIFLVFTLFYVILVTRKGFSKLKEEHKIIKSYTDMVLENMADAVIATDKFYNFKYFNLSASRIFQLDSDAITDKNYLDIFPGDLLFLKSADENNQIIINKEIEFLSHSGIKKILEISISFVKNNENSNELIIAIINDKTEKHLLQRQIERKDKLSAMGELAAGVAHEIRNPLNSINIIAQRIQYEFVPTEDLDEYTNLISTIRSEVIRVNKIIKQFLEFTSPPKLNLVEADLNDLVKDCINFFDSEAQLKHIILTADLIENIKVFLDKERIKQVLVNLIKNSIEAIEAEGFIKVSTKIDSQNAIIEISDNGIGFSDELKSKIFNIYFTTKSAGTGLGLSIVHQIINDHSGTIDVFSTKGEGSTFVIKLPLSKI